jgi:hypothetical protein
LRPGSSNKLRPLGIAVAIVTAALLGVLAPAASAAPANDNFAAREVIPSTLPATAEGSNVGATAPPNEFIAERMFEGHNSVWWQWEAPSTQIVSIGTCGTEFQPFVAVFAGESESELLLHRVVPAREPLGSTCASAHSFHAVAGTVYEIAVQGEGSGGIPGVVGPSAGEGQIRLQINAGTPPANDDFADATPIQQIIWELPNGERTMLGGASGDNWSATSEPGEPIHAGVGGGASAWYRLIAPGAGKVNVSTSFNEHFHPVLAVYTGSAVSALTPIAATTESGRPVSFDAEAGEEFHIAVDGLPDGEGVPWMSNLGLTVGEALPPGTGNASGAPELQTATVKPRPAAKAPDASASTAAPAPPQVTGRSVDPRSRTASFRFASSVQSASFRCKLDQAAFRACASPLRLRHLDLGAHRLGIETVVGRHRVSAPAVLHFTIRAPQGPAHGSAGQGASRR